MNRKQKEEKDIQKEREKEEREAPREPRSLGTDRKAQSAVPVKESTRTVPQRTLEL